MNTLLQKCVIQAVAYAQEQTFALNLTFYQTQEVYNQKFAALIMEECAKAIDIDKHVEWPALAKIEEHFGI